MTNLIVLDFDGTISPISTNPLNVKVSKKMEKSIIELSKANNLMILTGRDSNFVKRFFDSKKIHIVGNYGNKSSLKNKESLLFKKTIQKKIRLFDGVTLENKETSFAIHYRKLKTNKSEFYNWLDSIELCHKNKFKILKGKKVIEFLSKQSISKKDFLEKYLSKHKFSKVVYVGDDLSDILVINFFKNKKWFTGFLVKSKEINSNLLTGIKCIARNEILSNINLVLTS